MPASAKLLVFSPRAAARKLHSNLRMFTRIFVGLLLSGMLVGCFAEHRPRVVQARYQASCPEGYYYTQGNCYERQPVRRVRAVVVEVR